LLKAAKRTHVDIALYVKHERPVTVHAAGV
jgi:hypothetical protein